MLCKSYFLTKCSYPSKIRFTYQNSALDNVGHTRDIKITYGPNKLALGEAHDPMERSIYKKGHAGGR